ncbi:MAG: hypothetical protein O3B96_00700 [bacterium]|nr:hypothetical protein [bacterium]
MEHWGRKIDDDVISAWFNGIMLVTIFMSAASLSWLMWDSIFGGGVMC